MKNLSDMTDRELDAAIAVEVMGWKVKTVHDPVMGVTFDNYVNANKAGVLRTDLWQPSYFISDAWQVVERMRELGWSVNVLTQPSGFPCSVTVTNYLDSANVKNPSAPRAICEAALAAVRNSKEQA